MVPIQTLNIGSTNTTTNTNGLKQLTQTGNNTQIITPQLLQQLQQQQQQQQQSVKIVIPNDVDSNNTNNGNNSQIIRIIGINQHGLGYCGGHGRCLLDHRT